MVEIEMPMKEYTFLKEYYDDISRYIIRMEYHIEDVVLHIRNEKFNDFRLDYNSMIVRKGMTNSETFTDIGLRLHRIYDMYIYPAEAELQGNGDLL